MVELPSPCSLDSTATEVVVLRRQMAQAQEQVACANERISTANQQLVHASQLLANLSMRLSALEEQLAHQPANLLTLPRELRDEIYKHALQAKRSVSIHLWQLVGRDDITLTYLALSSVSKQIRHEAAEVFFKNERFDWATLYPVMAIPEPYLRNMKTIDILGYGQSGVCMTIRTAEDEFQCCGNTNHGQYR